MTDTINTTVAHDKNEPEWLADDLVAIEAAIKAPGHESLHDAAKVLYLAARDMDTYSDTFDNGDIAQKIAAIRAAFTVARESLDTLEAMLSDAIAREKQFAATRCAELAAIEL